MNAAGATLAQALGLHQAGRLQEAERVYQQVLAAEPAHVDALYLLGLLTLQSGQPAAAEGLLRRALDGRPAFPEASANLGTALAQQGKLQEAVPCWRQSLALKSDDADAASNLANALVMLGQMPEAAAVLHWLAQLRPGDAEVHRRFGDALQSQGRLEESIAAYRQALALAPGHLQVLNNMAYSLIRVGRPDEAEVALTSAVRLDPNYASAYNNLGTALVRQDRLDQALSYFRRAVEIDPDFALAHNNIGTFHFEQGKLDEAEAGLQQALRLQPGFVEPRVNLANVRLAQGRLDEAATGYRQALSLQPDNAGARGNLGMALLAMGNFAEGWREYEFRHVAGAGRPSFQRSEPFWDGSPLAERTILLHAEQGFGDTLQFIRYARLLRERGARVLLDCPASMIPLLKRCPGIDELVPQGSPLPRFDVHSPLLSLPRLLGTTLDTIPADVPYLSADPALVARWHADLSKHRKPPASSLKPLQIGIAWQGRPTFRDDRWRSIPLAEFEPLARLPGVQLVSLQKGHGSEQVPALADRVPLLDLASRLDLADGAFMDTAAVIENLDLVITSDTSIAHLAGALGAKVWVALAHVAEWRWLVEREDSPWYPTMRLFRQQRPGDWPGVFQRMAVQVAAEFLRSR